MLNLTFLNCNVAITVSKQGGSSESCLFHTPFFLCGWPLQWNILGLCNHKPSQTVYSKRAWHNSNNIIISLYGCSTTGLHFLLLLFLFCCYNKHISASLPWFTLTAGMAHTQTTTDDVIMANILFFCNIYANDVHGMFAESLAHISSLRVVHASLISTCTQNHRPPLVHSTWPHPSSFQTLTPGPPLHAGPACELHAEKQTKTHKPAFNPVVSNRHCPSLLSSTISLSMHNNTCFGTYLQSVSTHHRNLLKLLVTISRVIYFIPQAHLDTVSQN